MKTIENLVKLSCLLAVSAFSASAMAVGDLMPFGQINVDVGNKATLQRGARNFVNYCMGCHSAKYVRYNRLAQDLGITEDQLINNLMFLGGKPHDTMLIAMPDDDAASWFGQPPPDLTLVARSKGTDYLYNFLKGFYLEERSPTGVNNIALPGASMPNVLWELQGLRNAVFETEMHEDGTEHETVRFEQVTEGTMNEAEFDQFVRDLVTFLAYIGEPMRQTRERLGIWVIGYLLIFLLFAYLLKKEIWKDVK